MSDSLLAACRAVPYQGYNITDGYFSPLLELGDPVSTTIGQDTYYYMFDSYSALYEEGCWGDIYSPLDTIADGLMLQLGMNGTDGVPLEVRFLLSGTDGVFYRFDALAGGYISAGSSVDVEGETVYWVLPVPVEGQVAPVLQIDVTETESGRFLGRIMLELEIEKNSYVVAEERFHTAAVDEGRDADNGEDAAAGGNTEMSSPAPAGDPQEDPNG